jgi:methyltransferase
VKQSALLLILVLIISRLYELYLSKANERLLLSQYGAKLMTTTKEHYWVVIFHVLWFVGLIVEHSYFPSTYQMSAFFTFLAYLCLCIAQIMRWESMRSLGVFWTTKLYYSNKWTKVTTGIYKYFNHPSYIAVMIEFIVVPMLLGAFYTLIVFFIFNLFLLLNRMKIETKFLNNHSEAL